MQSWLEANAFAAGAGAAPGAETFSIVIPPPNVTGSLHIGHALNNTIQDILIRFERMRGKDVLWQPGTDHAGIATQMIVERQLMERQQPVAPRDGPRGIPRARLGVEGRKRRHHHEPAQAPGRLGRLVARTLHHGRGAQPRPSARCSSSCISKGLIYRAKRLVNWHPGLETAISDLEVENIETDGKMWHLKYPIEGSSDYIIVATTRPETMLGDVARRRASRRRAL